MLGAANIICFSLLIHRRSKCSNALCACKTLSNQSDFFPSDFLRKFLPRFLIVLALGWLVWPLLRPRLWPAPGGPLVVVLDGYHRLEGGRRLQLQRQAPLLLIACPSTLRYATTSATLSPSHRPPQLLLQGFDTVTQMTALARWLSTAPWPVAEVLLVSDREHLPRAGYVAQLALGAQGIRVTPFAAPPAPPELLHRMREGPLKSARDVLRITAWRTSGSTLAFLLPQWLEARRQGCGL